jgi:phage terminase large subunit-like protein
LIYFPRPAPFLFDLEQELLHFPRGEFADQVDALAYAAMEVQRMKGPPASTSQADQHA